jgi:hypothetical protein
VRPFCHPFPAPTVFVGMKLPVPLLMATLLVPPYGLAAETVARIVIQNSPLAGFRYYQGRSLWDELEVGDALALVREPDNPFDPNAVRIEWRGHKLGYVPRRENARLARQMDHGAAVEARITELRTSRNGRNLVSYEISLRLP